MKFKLQIKQQKGFTIMELIIAITVFSALLLMVSIGAITIGRLYYKNLAQARTQETARSVMNDISRSIQLSKGVIEQGEDQGDVRVVCVGNDRYTYRINHQLSGSGGGNDFALWHDRLPIDSSCEPSQRTSGSELLSDNMRLLVFSVENPTGSGCIRDPDQEEDERLSTAGDTCRIRISVAYGDDDLLCAGNICLDNQSVEITDLSTVSCRPGREGGTFCAVSGLDTSVKRRL